MKCELLLHVLFVLHKIIQYVCGISICGISKCIGKTREAVNKGKDC